MSSIELAAFSSSELTAFLSQPFNAHVVNEERWYGMSHLHDVCVKGNFDQVQILIRFGADVNAANAGGETPAHLAARRGIVAIIDELRKSGADLNARDQADRTALHFAAFGGNPSALSYLIFYCRLDPFTKNKTGETFLHLLCQYKKVEAVFYCLNAGIFSGSQINDLRDDAGKNPFDLSLENSTAEIPYLLLNKSEFSLLQPWNSGSGEPTSPSSSSSLLGSNDEDEDKEAHFRRSTSSPPDPSRTISSKAESNPSFAQLHSSVVFHRRVRRLFHRSDSLPLLGPYPAYIFLILKPFLLPPLLFLLCRFLIGPWTPSYSGGVFYLFALYFAWNYKTENYRMNHVSKWPNPFMASLFACGIFYDIFVFYVVIWPSMTTMSGYTYGYFDAFVVVTTLTLTYQYLSLILKDPGRAPPCSWLSNGGPPSTSYIDDDRKRDHENAVASVFVGDHCPNCRVRDDDSSAAHVRHCRLCDACMQGFDHHCLFLLTCVAKRNRRLFLSFLVFVDVFCIPTLLLSTSGYLSRKATSISPSVASEESPLRLLCSVISISISDCDSAVLVFLCLGNWLAWLWIAYLIYNQIYYIARSHTTSCVGIKACRDDLSRKLSWNQFISNVLYFLANGELRARAVALA